MRVTETRHHTLHQHQQFRGIGPARSKPESFGEHNVPEDGRIPAGGAHRYPRRLSAAGASKQGDDRKVYGTEDHLVERSAVIGLAK